MAAERTPSNASLVDVLDRVLDKGIVIDAWVRVSLVGVDLLSVEARVVVASIETYLAYADTIGHRPAPGRQSAADADRLQVENLSLRRRIAGLERPAVEN